MKHSRHSLIACLWVLLLALTCAAKSVKVPAGSKIYVTAESGIDSTLLKAALAKMNVPVTLIGDKDKADFILDLSALDNSLDSAFGDSLSTDSSILKENGNSQTTIRLVKADTMDLVFLFAAGKRSTAEANVEACAKHLKAAVK
jgi:hypothetical protein